MPSYFCHLFLYSLHPLLFSCCGLKEPVWSVIFKVVLHLFFKRQYYNIRDKNKKKIGVGKQIQNYTKERKQQRLPSSSLVVQTVLDQWDKCGWKSVLNLLSLLMHPLLRELCCLADGGTVVGLVWMLWDSGLEVCFCCCRLQLIVKYPNAVAQREKGEKAQNYVSLSFFLSFHHSELRCWKCIRN